MVRPAAFGYNKESASSNLFQQQSTLSAEEINRRAQAEFDEVVQVFLEADVDLSIVHDTPEPIKPDAIFPNNWLGMLHFGHVHLFPMLAKNRRAERRDEIIEQINQKFVINSITNWTDGEKSDLFLEGTGSMVFDHQNRIAFACLSDRTFSGLLMQFCDTINYKEVSFYASDWQGNAIYHTNVMMSIGESFALYCADVIQDQNEREMVRSKLEELGKEIILITVEQMNSFAGNILQFKNKKNQKCIAISKSAFDSLDEVQVKLLSKHGALLVVSIPTIESVGGGSIRCMMAEVFLPLR